MEDYALFCEEKQKRDSCLDDILHGDDDLSRYYNAFDGLYASVMMRVYVPLCKYPKWQTQEFFGALQKHQWGTAFRYLMLDPFATGFVKAMYFFKEIVNDTIKTGL